jgi:uncharacterized membrane protein YeiH
MAAGRLDLVSVVALAMMTGLGGGIIRDVLLCALVPTTRHDGRYLAVALVSALLVLVGRRLPARVVL